MCAKKRFVWIRVSENGVVVDWGRWSGVGCSEWGWGVREAVLMVVLYRRGIVGFCEGNYSGDPVEVEGFSA